MTDIDIAELSKKIEAILFQSGEAVKIVTLEKILGQKKDIIKKGIEILREKYKENSFDILCFEERYELVIKPEYSSLIDQSKKEYFIEDLSQAGLEVLSIIIFKGPISKIETDDFRGINSGLTIRRLLVLGLIVEKEIEFDNEKKGDINDSQYIISNELLKHFGFKKEDECKEYFQDKYITNDETKE